MTQIEINKISYDATVTIRAAKTYQDLTGKDVGEIETITDMGVFIFACIDAAFRVKKEKCTITIDDVYDSITLTEMIEYIKLLMPETEKKEIALVS